MNGLQTACEDILIEKLNIQNAAEIVVVANKANSTRLFKIALDFIIIRKSKKCYKNQCMERFKTKSSRNFNLNLNEIVCSM